MKEKRKSKAIYVIGFLAATFLAAFILIEFRDDYLAVAGAGVVMLIQAYFLVNKIEEDIYEKHELNRQDINDKFEEVTYKMDEKCDKIEQIQRAIYVASKKGTETIENRIDEMAKQVEEIQKKD